MKKLFTLILATVVSGAAFAQPYTVTFQVDMKNETVNPLGVSIAGNFQANIVGGGAAWTPGATMLTETPVGSKIYKATVNLSAGGVSGYKFINGVAWGSDEGVPGACNVGGDRSIDITGSTTVPLVCYASCVACPVAAPDTLNVTFQVDMTTNIGMFGAPFNDTVSVAGNFQKYAPIGVVWQPGKTVMTPIAVGSKIYQAGPFRIPEGTYAYKFLAGPAWGYDETVSGGCATNGDRALVLDGTPNQNVTVGPFCFGSCNTCTPGAPRDVIFRVDGNNETARAFAVNGTFFRPSFQAATNVAMPQGTTTDVYEYTFPNMYPGDYVYSLYNGGAAEDFAAVPAGGCFSTSFGGKRRPLSLVGGTGPFYVDAYVFNSCDLSTLVATESVRNAAYFQVSPNPFSGKTVINFNNANNETFDVIIADVAGKQIRTINKQTGNSVEIAAGDMAGGVYFATLVTQSGARFTQKLIVQ